MKQVLYVVDNKLNTIYYPIYITPHILNTPMKNLLKIKTNDVEIKKVQSLIELGYITDKELTRNERDLILINRSIKSPKKIYLAPNMHRENYGDINPNYILTKPTILLYNFDKLIPITKDSIHKFFKISTNLIVNSIFIVCLKSLYRFTYLAIKNNIKLRLNRHIEQLEREVNNIDRLNQEINNNE